MQERYQPEELQNASEATKRRFVEVVKELAFRGDLIQENLAEAVFTIFDSKLGEEADIRFDGRSWGDTTRHPKTLVASVIFFKSVANGKIMKRSIAFMNGGQMMEYLNYIEEKRKRDQLMTKEELAKFRERAAKETLEDKLDEALLDEGATVSEARAREIISILEDIARR